MPIIMNNNGTQQALDSIKMNNQEIDKLYMGESLVYNHDAPVYMIRLWKGIVYSLDGYNYETLATYSSGESFDFGGYTKGKCIFARSNSENPNMNSYLTKEVRAGVLRNININPGVTTSTMAMDTDGEQIILCSSRNERDRKVHYSLDGGDTWNVTTNSMPDNIRLIRYIGNGEFFLFQYGSSYPTDGTYYYWSIQEPTKIYTRQFYNINGTAFSGSIDYMTHCEDGNYYVSTSSGTYKGSATRASVKCNENIKQVVYIYNKYYALYSKLSESDGGSPYISTDGINFTNARRQFSIMPYHLIKSNNKLCFVAKRSAGIINEDNSVQQTTFNSTIAEYSGSPIVTNRFHKM